MMSSIYGSNETALLALMERTGYHMLQENGQRKYGPPPHWNGPPPQRGCEIFVGKIPRDCFEDELVPVFELCGQIYEFRLMMDFSGTNRGYCFVMYTCRDDAKRAVRVMDNFEIRRGRFLGVCMSVDNCRLFIGGIPKNKQQDEILEEMKLVTDGVVDIIVYPSANDRTKNRGFAFVEYESHRAAAMARRKLIPGRIQLWGHQIAVDWAEPEKEVDEDTMSRVKVLYVRNLMLDTPEDVLRNLFNLAAGQDQAVERVKKIRDFAFIHFYERGDAVRALSVMNRKEIDGTTVEVTLAKPVDKNNYTRYTRSIGKLPSKSCAISSTMEQPQCLGLEKLEDMTIGSNGPLWDRRKQEFCRVPLQVCHFNDLNEGELHDLDLDLVDPSAVCSDCNNVNVPLASSGQVRMIPRVPLLGRCSSPSPNSSSLLSKSGEPHHLYDLLSDLKHSPAYSNQMQRQSFNEPVQELCVKQGWERRFAEGDASVAAAAVMMMCRGKTPGHDSLSLLRAGFPLSLLSMPTAAETTSLTDLHCGPEYASTPAASPRTAGTTSFPLSRGEVKLTSQPGTFGPSAASAIHANGQRSLLRDRHIT